MRVRWCVLVLGLVVAMAGCSSSTDPEPEKTADYPDISGLVVFYQFDGSLENAVSDEHDATARETPTYVEDHAGHANSAVLAIGDTIWVADHPDLDITGAITLAAWVKPDLSNRAYTAVIDKNYNEAYSLGLSGAAQADTVDLRAYIADKSLWASQIVPVGTGAWSHLALTFDGTTQKAEFFVNGILVRSATSSAILGTSDAKLRIGRSNFGDPYRGGIDQVAVFNRALTAAEVSELYGFE